MKRIDLCFGLLLILLTAGRTNAQTIVCNDQIVAALDENCAFTLTPQLALAGAFLTNCVVEIDKTLPLGDGPWVSPVCGPDDAGMLYQYRIKHLPSGNTCWGGFEVQDKRPPALSCTHLTLVDLDNGNPGSVTPADLNVTAVDACGATTLAFASGPGSLAFDCDNLGVSTVELVATDESGNSSTCQHTLVATGAQGCDACVAVCPPAAVVSFEEGNYSLLPAYQNGETEVLDAFGNAAFDAVTCGLLDSTYITDFEAGTAGYSWFTRQWLWLTATGQIAVCEQQVLFPTLNAVAVQGKIYLDHTPDCLPGGGEPGVSLFPVTVTMQPSGTQHSFAPDANGVYAAMIPFGTQDTGAEVRLVLPPGVSSVCPSALFVPNTSAVTAYTFDIGLQSAGECAILQTNLGANGQRRCQNNYFTLSYANVGLDTAHDASITIQLDPLISLNSADLPFTAGPDNTFTFEVGDVAPFVSRHVYLSVFISCDAVIGQTLCNEATGQPNIPCDGVWNEALVGATAECDGDSVSLQLINLGAEDMTAPLDFIVIEDFIMYHDGVFQLPSGGVKTVRVPANGSTWRIEADQVPDFPIAEVVSAAIEGCGGLNTPGAVNAYAASDAAVAYDRFCLAVSGSFDPNDKAAVPTGYGPAHLIRANTDLEYTIRFQNTGNDTAFRVVIVDTLSTLLDRMRLEAGAASHPYELKIFPGGILHFVFDPIALPDSNVNEAASHGFVQFRIAQQPDLPDGTLLENTAAIYFDNNDPIITNTVFHTIGYPFIALDEQTPHLPGVRVTLSPNPFRDRAVLSVAGQTLSDGQLILYDAQGRPVRTQALSGNSAGIERSGLPAGVYFFRVLEAGAPVASGKLQVH